MKDLSYHILDLANNSLRAQADRLDILLAVDEKKNQLVIQIKDNGKGMSKDMLSQLKNPFTTTRTLRNVGLGIPFFEDTCRMTDGLLQIESQLGQGTTVRGEMGYDHIDRPPMGDVVASLLTLLTSDQPLTLLVDFRKNKNQAVFNSQEIKDVIGDLSFNEPEVYQWLKAHIQDMYDQVFC